MSNLVPVPTLKEGSSPKIVGMQQTSPPTTNPPLQKPDFPWLGTVGTHPCLWQLHGRGRHSFSGTIPDTWNPTNWIWITRLPNLRIASAEHESENKSSKINVWNQIHQKELQTDRCLKLRLCRYRWPDSLEESQVATCRGAESRYPRLSSQADGDRGADRVNIIQVICVVKYLTKNDVSKNI